MTTVLASINQGLKTCLRESEAVYLFGEDILDPYGGAFKVTLGLSTAFKERVVTTPISEAGFIGLATGMAMRGLRPVVEIMFGDFITLGMDQLINHAAKMRWMSADEVRVPLVVRTPMGGRRGYGPTHSQSLEKHLLGTPGLRVLAPNGFSSPGDLLINAVLHDDDPVLFVEHKLLYGLEVWDIDGGDDFELETTKSLYPVSRIRLAGAPAPDVTIGAYGYSAHLAVEAIRILGYKHEVFAEVVTPTQLSPACHETFLQHVRETRKIITVEEAPGEFGWGAEILAGLQGSDLPGLQCGRVSAQSMPVPSSGPLENAVLPQVEDIISAVLSLV